MSTVRNTLEYLAGADLIKSANRHAVTVGEFELNKDQIRKDRSRFQRYALGAFVVNQVVNFAEVLNLGLMVSNSYDSLVRTHRQYDELVVSAIPHIMCGTVLECIRFLARKAVSLKEDSEHKSRVLRLYMRDAAEQRELERLYSDREKYWKEAEDEYTDG